MLAVLIIMIDSSKKTQMSVGFSEVAIRAVLVDSQFKSNWPHTLVIYWKLLQHDQCQR